jgi:hypothetical protein
MESVAAHCRTPRNRVDKTVVVKTGLVWQAL